MARKQEYYSLKNILECKAQYNILLGERSNGKSFAVKKYIIETAYNGMDNESGRFVYMRRWGDDIKTVSIKSYFADMILNENGHKYVNEFTHGDFDGIMPFQGKIYFYKLDENGDRVRDKRVIGRYVSLNEDERYKSQAFVGYENLVYEEFITNKIYLNNEPTRLQNFVSTIARHKKMTVFLVGNTLTRVCPYFSEWTLTGVLKQAIGTIEIYHFNTTNGMVNIAVERCANVNKESKMFFGRAEKQIVSGEWEVNDMPKLPRAHESYDKLYEILICYQNFKFCLELLHEKKNGGIICFVYPYTKNRYILRVVSDVFSDSPNVSYRLNMNRKAERLINECFKTGKVCYSDNLTGTDFQNVNKYFKIGNLVN